MPSAGIGRGLAAPGVHGPIDGLNRSAGKSSLALRGQQRYDSFSRLSGLMAIWKSTLCIVWARA